MIRAGVARLSPRCSLQFNLNLRARRAVTCKPYHKRNSCSAPCLGRPAAVVAIDVEYAHFLVNGQVKTAAAEVCVVKEDNSVLLESFICPGGFPQCTVR